MSGLFKIKILQDISIRDELILNRGDTFEAVEDGDFVMINVGEAGTIKAPKLEFYILVKNGVIAVLSE